MPAYSLAGRLSNFCKTNSLLENKELESRPPPNTYQQVHGTIEEELIRYIFWI